MTLDELSIKYKNMKGSKYHDYMIWYEKYLAPTKNKIKVFLEIGIGYGVSLRIWREYFPNAIIYGIDHNQTCKQHEEDRIKVCIGRQENLSFLEDVCKQTFDYDIVIDDGDHIYEHQLISLSYLLPKLKKGGYYFIEDLSLLNGLIEKKITKFSHIAHLQEGFKVLTIYMGVKGEAIWGVKRE